MDWKSLVESLLADPGPGLSIEAIAEAMGVTPNAIRELLSERTKSPRASAAMALLALAKQHGLEAAA